MREIIKTELSRVSEAISLLEAVETDYEELLDEILLQLERLYSLIESEVDEEEYIDQAYETFINEEVDRYRDELFEKKLDNI